MSETNELTVQPRPRVRYGAVAWGLIVCIVAASTLQIVLNADRRTAFLEWMLALTPATLGIITLLTMGAASLLIGLLALIRRAQK